MGLKSNNTNVFKIYVVVWLMDMCGNFRVVIKTWHCLMCSAIRVEFNKTSIVEHNINALHERKSFFASNVSGHARKPLFFSFLNNM